MEWSVPRNFNYLKQCASEDERNFDPLMLYCWLDWPTLLTLLLYGEHFIYRILATFNMKCFLCLVKRWEMRPLSFLLLECKGWKMLEIPQNFLFLLIFATLSVWNFRTSSSLLLWLIIEKAICLSKIGRSSAAHITTIYFKSFVWQFFTICEYCDWKTCEFPRLNFSVSKHRAVSRRRL